MYTYFTQHTVYYTNIVKEVSMKRCLIHKREHNTTHEVRWIVQISLLKADKHVA